MIWVSALLVSAAAAVVLLTVGEQGADLHLGYQELIHARIPWLLLGSLWLGLGLGIAAWLRKRAAYRLAIVLLELPLVAFGSWYFLVFSFPAVAPLAIDVGDTFPSYALNDQDGRLHRLDAGVPREPALYIFYRGDW